MLPFTAFLINGLFGRRYLKDFSQWVSIATIIGSMLIAMYAFTRVAGGEIIKVPLYNWVAFGDFNINIGLYIDHLTSIMLLVVTIVSTLVHIYTVGYLHGDPGFYRFFAYLSLFTFSMLMLVLADNYLVIYVFWESVGLCSYLLIGFWYKKKSATDAGKKAFIANRVGDFGFGIGIMTIFTVFGTFNFHGPAGIFANAHLYVGNVFNILGFSVPVIPLICLLLFVGAMGKSAQFPLFVWLPDAMEGPTSCSALIHAATMVTAGVYMVARSSAIYVLSPGAMQVVAVVGCFTAIFAATIAVVQNDIKKVLAYSTISQLGYMVLACGVGAFTAGIFHLMTHAFFKALLFLGAGSVIHAMSGEQDMRKMGGLLPHMKWTGYSFLAATLAIAGFPLLSGFFSKDQILGEVFKGGHYILWFIGLFTAFLTAFYMFRLYFMTFLGKSRVEKHAAEHLHESPKVMTVPLVILAVFSVFVGVIVGVPLENGLIHKHLHNVVPSHHQVMEIQKTAKVNDISIVSKAYAAADHGAEHAAEGATHGGAEHKKETHAKGGQGEHAAAEHGGEHAGGHHLLQEIFLIGSSVLVGLLGIYLAYLFYLKRVDEKTPEKIAKKFPTIYTTLLNKYYIDEIYDVAFINSSKDLGFYMWKFDANILDGIVNRVAAFVKWFAWQLYRYVDICILDFIVNKVASSTKWLSKQLYRYVDVGVVDFIVNFTAKSTAQISVLIYEFFDLPVIDGMVNGIAKLIEFLGNQVRKLQTGYVQTYVFVFIFGLIILVSIYLMNVVLSGAGSI
jgi:NADH-quinone oxidoreductase subunit L